MKAISPVIATVIIVAVAIAISIAVALWMTGLVGAFTGVEKLEIVNAYASATAPGDYTITIMVKNTGTKTATIDMIFINNVPRNISGLPVTLNPGDSKTLTFNFTGTAGQTISITIHTASGGQYPTTITLP